MRDFITWNLLHRVHAENWREPVAEAFPDEAERIAGISSFLKRALTGGGVACLQEVSGDQLASLRATFDGVHSFQYPRRPKLKSGGRAPLLDPTEHLVIVAEDARLCLASAFESDRGKGFIGVELEGLVVVSTHISWDKRRNAQLAILRDALGERDGVLLGDFNAASSVVLPALGPEWTAAVLPDDALPTRPCLDDGAGDVIIDHIIARGARVTRGAVVDVGGLSDHNLVRASVVYS